MQMTLVILKPQKRVQHLPSSAIGKRRSPASIFSIVIACFAQNKTTLPRASGATQTVCDTPSPKNAPLLCGVCTDSPRGKIRMSPHLSPQRRIHAKNSVNPLISKYQLFHFVRRNIPYRLIDGTAAPKNNKSRYAHNIKTCGKRGSLSILTLHSLTSPVCFFSNSPSTGASILQGPHQSA